MGHPYDIEHAQRLHSEWCRQLQEQAGLSTVEEAELRMIVAMFELREMLDAKAAIAVANALPALERGIFLGGWSLDQAPDPSADPQQFHQRVHERVQRHHSPPTSLTSDVFSLWRSKLGSSRANAIRDQLPAGLLPLW